MDTQIATTPGGLVHAVSCVQSDEDARRFKSTMQMQGFSVVRLSGAAAALRFARDAQLSRSLEAAARAAHLVEQAPPIGTQVRYRWQAEPLTGTVLAVLRFPADHPHCPGRVALHVRSPGLEACLGVDSFEVVEAEAATPEVPPVPSRPHAPAGWVQPSLW